MSKDWFDSQGARPHGTSDDSANTPQPFPGSLPDQSRGQSHPGAPVPRQYDWAGNSSMPLQQTGPDWGGRSSQASQPLQGTYDPATGVFTPSQPLYGYPGMPSQPLSSNPNVPSQYVYGIPAALSQPLPQPIPQTRRIGLRISKQALIIGGAVLILLALVGSALGYVNVQTGAASTVADQVCTRLLAQDYGSLYSVLTASDQAQDSSAQAGQLFVDLDRLEGKVSSCHQVSGTYHYTLGASTATTQLSITRGTIGVLQGTLALQQKEGAWKAELLTTALLGNNPSALAAGYCSVLRSQLYSELGQFVGSGSAAGMNSDDFEQNLTLQDKYDGPVTNCSVTQITSGNTDSTATLSMSITRAKTGTVSGQVSLVSSGNVWTLERADSALLGTDYRPVLVGTQFCNDLQSNKMSDAYSLFDSGYQQQYSLSALKANFDTSGWSFFCTDPDMSTYKISDGQASYNLGIAYSGVDAYHNSGTLAATLYFALDSGTWKLDGYEYHTA